jgi:hypothetical protein
MENVEITQNGLQCDNPNCDWKDTTIPAEDFVNWVDKPCPTCGENVLTEKDFNNWQAVMITASMLNSLSEKEITILAKARGIENPDVKTRVKAMVNLHDTITLKDIEIICPPVNTIKIGDPIRVAWRCAGTLTYDTYMVFTVDEGRISAMDPKLNLHSFDRATGKCLEKEPFDCHRTIEPMS